MQIYEEEANYSKAVKEPSKKKVKRIQWNTPFNFQLVEPKK